MGRKPVIAINTIAFHGYDFPTAFRAIAELGGQYVEPLLIPRYYQGLTEEYFNRENAEKLRALAARFGLAVPALAAHMELGHKDAFENFSRRMEFASVLGADIVHTNSAHKSRGKEFFEVIDRLIPVAESLGLIITLENPGDGSGNLAGCGKEVAGLVKRIDSPHIRVNYDPANAFAYSDGALELEEDFAAALPCAAYLHLKQVRIGGGGQWSFVGIEDGEIDYGCLLAPHARQVALLPIGLEFPLRFSRDPDRGVMVDSSKPPPELNQIKNILANSLSYLHGLLD